MYAENHSCGVGDTLFEPMIPRPVRAAPFVVLAVSRHRFCHHGACGLYAAFHHGGVAVFSDRGTRQGREKAVLKDPFPEAGFVWRGFRV